MLARRRRPRSDVLPPLETPPAVVRFRSVMRAVAVAGTVTVVLRAKRGRAALIGAFTPVGGSGTAPATHRRLKWFPGLGRRRGY